MAESFLLVAQQVLMLYLIMAVGFVLGKARLIDDRGSVAMSNLVMYAVSPSILVVAFQRELDMASLRNFGLVLLVALAVHILAAVSVLLVRDKDPQRQSCLRFAVVFANCGFMGYPLMSAMLSSEGVFYGSAYVVVFTVLSWTLGVYIMTRDRHCLAIKPIFCNPGTISVIVAMGAVSAADPAAGDPACTDHAPFQPQHAAADGRAGLSALTRELPRGAAGARRVGQYDSAARRAAAGGRWGSACC